LGADIFMHTSSFSSPIERARPLLGTRVNIKVGGLTDVEARQAIDAGFAVVAEIHDLMSFHEASSDVSALNRDASRAPVTVNPITYDVIGRALEIAASSSGVFDISIAAQLVAWGFLPRPDDAPDPSPQASWGDIELLGENRIRFHRPLWVDLGGIAKGYAVDRAVDKIKSMGALQCAVNAGGDLRVSGPLSERVLLRTDAPGDTVPVLEIENGSLASSSGREQVRQFHHINVGPHLHGVERKAVGTHSFASVVAEECVIADALTKIVLARGTESEPVLRAHNATGYMHDAGGGWRVIGGERL
jgi:FAD:protein FMN transferase